MGQSSLSAESELVPGQSVKTMEQRRLEAKEKLLREKQRKLSETSSSSSPDDTRMRSRSFTGRMIVKRIEEIDPIEVAASTSRQKAFMLEQEGMSHLETR